MARTTASAAATLQRPAAIRVHRPGLAVQALERLEEMIVTLQLSPAVSGRKARSPA
jgi:hypothetical protein